MVNDKDEFWLRMDLDDVENAGAFLSRDVWDKYILKKKSGITIKPTDYTKGHRG